MTENRRARPRLFTIPPDAEFLPSLARAMLAGDLPEAGGEPPSPRDLADWTVFLPTRRAARALSAALLEEAPSRSQILARIHPLGDVDEDELALAGDADDPLADIPPAIQPLPRRFLLARLINEWAGNDTRWPLAEILRAHPGEAMKLARPLASLIDHFENEEIAFDEIGRLLALEQPEHRLAARDLLELIRQRYPQELKRRGLMGAAARRSALIRAQARRFQDNPPDGPVIAAGSTGAIPATAALLSVIARLPRGCVILPGLDREMDKDSWKALAPSHPQYGMKQLLERMRADRSEVDDLPGLIRPPHGPARCALLSEAMRPAEETDKWRASAQGENDLFREGARGLAHVHARTRQQEALAIALIMRRALETPGRTAALITPDRDLARQVRAELGRWGVTVDDSAGQPLPDTPPGAFLLLLAEAALSGFAPDKLAALAAHPLACFGLPRDAFVHDFSALELAVLRGISVFPGIGELEKAARQRCREAAIAPHHEHRALAALQERWRAIHAMAERLSGNLEPMARVFTGHEARSLESLLRLHVSVAEAITTPPGGPCALWSREAGEALAAAISALLAHAREAPDFTPRDYAAFLGAELAARPVRPRHAAHPRLSILGLLEARLTPADEIILGGLNEDVWPPAARNDPFLNRLDKAALGLPVPERRTGLSAHDFVQAAGKARVWLTSSARIDEQPAVESRWLLRLRALATAAGDERALEPEEPWLEWARMLDAPQAPPRPAAAPRPAPEPSLRPDHFSASRVSTLLSDPYAIFASDILRLSPLPPLTSDAGAREMGVIIHGALEAFARDHPRQLPDDAAHVLRDYLLRAFDARVDDAARRAFWEPRFARMAEWLASKEREWREGIEKVLPEQRGKLRFTAAGRDFTLSARADRIDLLTDAGIRLIDYKTGAVPETRPGKAGYSPQLDLETAMLMQGAFGEAGAAGEVCEAAFVKISGGAPPGEVTLAASGEELRAQAARALEGFKALLEDYQDPAQPYLPLDHGDRERRPHDFDHLSRWPEWMHTAGEEQA